MVSMTYKQAVLVWDSGHASDRAFNAIALGMMASFLALSFLIARLPAPEVDRTIPSVIPERIVKFMAEMSIPKPAPEITPSPAPKPEEPIQRPTPAAPKPLTKPEAQARKNAQTSGLLVLAKELSTLADASNINTMVARKLNTAPTNTAAATMDTHILTSDTGSKSVRVSPGSHVGTVSTTKLADNPQNISQGLLDASGARATGPAGGSAKPGRGNIVSVRGDEDVAIVMDQNKSSLYSIYNRARRANPGLKGKIVLVLTIQPSGQVSNVIIKSSELNAPDLEASLVARVRQFDFGQRQGGALTVTVPVEFLPS